MKQKLIALCVAGMMLLTACGQTGEESTSPAPTTPDQQVEDTNLDLTQPVGVTIEVADYGTIQMELDPTVAPISVENFVKLVESGFYDGLTFHRIIDGFMIQGGDPKGNGTGGSDEKIKGEFSENGVENGLSHLRGTVSMARSMDMNSASSQFFIVHQDSTFLDGKYAAFGTVTEGMDVVDAICEAVQVEDGNGTVKPENQPKITSITIVEA